MVREMRCTGPIPYHVSQHGSYPVTHTHTHTDTVLQIAAVCFHPDKVMMCLSVCTVRICVCVCVREGGGRERERGKRAVSVQVYLWICDMKDLAIVTM